jgi:hypothetical protein
VEGRRHVAGCPIKRSDDKHGAGHLPGSSCVQDRRARTQPDPSRAVSRIWCVRTKPAVAVARSSQIRGETQHPTKNSIRPSTHLGEDRTSADHLCAPPCAVRGGDRGTYAGRKIRLGWFAWSTGKDREGRSWCVFSSVAAHVWDGNGITQLASAPAPESDS